MTNPARPTMQWTTLAALLAACLAIGICTHAASAGTVLSRQGKTYVGKVELKADNQVVISPAEGDAVTVPLQDVVRLSMADAAAPAPPATAPTTAAATADADAHLPAPWQQRDIGSVKQPGNAAEDKGVFSLHGSGWGIWGGQDSFHFVYLPLTGDGEVIAHVVDPPTEEAPLLAGLTIRESLESASPEASVMLHPGGVPRINCRPPQGARTPADLKQQSWIRLFRTADRFGAMSSRDGVSWLPVGWVNVKMGATVYAGLACAATGNQKLVASTFDHVTVRSLDAGPAEGLGLVDGTVLAGRPKGFDGQLWRYTDPAGVEHTLPAKTVAYLFTRPLPADQRGLLPGGKMSVSLLNGDAIEGEVKGFRDGRLTIDSLVFGAQTPELTKVLTAALRPVAIEGTFSVSTRDGTIYRCKELTVASGVVNAAGGLAGTATVKAEDLAWLKVDPAPAPGEGAHGKR